MRSFDKFVPNRKATFTCGDLDCGHTFDRHVIAKSFRGCLVVGCQCGGTAVFTRPIPPDIQEFVTDLKSKKRVGINQPAPPPAVGGM